MHSLVHLPVSFPRMTGSVGLHSIFCLCHAFPRKHKPVIFMEESEYKELGELAKKAKIEALA